jgi:hypothetical protein
MSETKVKGFEMKGTDGGTVCASLIAVSIFPLSLSLQSNLALRLRVLYNFCRWQFMLHMSAYFVEVVYQVFTYNSCFFSFFVFLGMGGPPAPVKAILKQFSSGREEDKMSGYGL